MPLELVVFRLPSGRCAAADTWLTEFQHYLAQLPPCPAQASITVRESDRLGDAFWQGVPFLLVGQQEEMLHYFSALSTEARCVYKDCGYFWCLSGTDQYLLTPERTIVLNWEHKHFEVIASRLKLMCKYPGLAGLSNGTHKVRMELERLTVGRKGPWSSVLILGESGTGKERVAEALYANINHAASGKDPKAFAPIACGSFDKELLNAQLFGIGPGIATQVRARDGLLMRGSNGCIFLDDCDTALELIQGPLLRVMSTLENEAAEFYRLGEENEPGKACKTMVWLIFSTNANIMELVEKKRLREDFIFRFKDRIIHLPSLRQRPADIPAIAHHSWHELGVKRPLSALVLQQIFKHPTQWRGNVRALQALLSLAASMISLPAHNGYDQRRIFDEIMRRGDEYFRWVDIIRSESFTGPLSTSEEAIQAILDLDAGHYCFALKQGQAAPPTGSEQAARASLTEIGCDAFVEALKKATSGKGKVIRPSIRLARIVAYLARRPEEAIDWHISAKLCEGVSEDVAKKNIELLVKVGLLREKTPAGTKEAATYERVSALFN